MQSDTVYIVIINNGDTEPELWGFEFASDADDFASVRGGCDDIQIVTVLDEHEAKALIDAEAKERADEEKFDRMRQEGF